MSWHTLRGHEKIVEGFRRSVARGRLGQAFLFVGPEGIGKKRFAVQLAKTLLCSANAAETFEPCGACRDCHLVDSATHPDLLLIECPADKHELPVELFIGRRERRNQEGMRHDLSLRPSRARRKVAVIDDADLLNVESANCLLKTLEEPPPRAVLILVGTAADRQLPTIRSRCQIVRFAPLSSTDVAQILEAEVIVTDRSEAARLAERSGGSVQRAVELADAGLGEFRQKLFERLCDPQFDSVALAREVNEFVEAVCSENAARRARARQLVGFCAEYYHAVLRLLCGVDPQGLADDEFAACKQLRDHLAPNGASIEVIDTVAGMVDRSLEASYHIDRRVHLALSLECLLDDLGRTLETVAV